MKTSICLFAVFVSASLFAVDVPALPGAEFADTEVSTNVALAVGAARNRRLVFSVELQASPSNNVEVAVGCDADADGRLSLAESALVVGYDCGEWFVRSAATDCHNKCHGGLNHCNDALKVERLKVRTPWGLKPIGNSTRLAPEGRRLLGSGSEAETLSVGDS